MGNLAARDLFFLAVLLVLAAYFVGFAHVTNSVIGGVTYAGRLFTGQQTTSTTAAHAA